MEDVGPHRLDAVEDARPAEPGEADLEAQVAAQAVAEGPALLEQPSRARDQLAHQAAEAVRHPPRVQVPLPHRVALQQVARDVDAVLAQVDRHVLPVVRELEAGADRVGEGL